MILEYILVGVICFTVGHNSAERKHKDCNRAKVVVVHKHKHKKHKFRFGRKLKRKHYHRNGTINMMCRNGWSW